MLQADYGGFNPRFLGVSVFYDSPASYREAHAYLTGDGPSNTAADLHSIILRSVFDHEARHYIDFLISPYSTAVFRLRLMALINGTQALALASEIPGSVLPVPLSQWALEDDARRAVRSAEWAELLGESVSSVEVPHSTLSQLQSDLPAATLSVADLPADRKFQVFIQATIRAYIRIDMLTQGFAPTADNPLLFPAYIHEASALTAQIAAIYTGQSLSDAATFLTFLIDSELPQAQVWQLHLQLAVLLERLSSGNDDALTALRRILSITVWAMLGDFHEERSRACPATRFWMLLSAVVDDLSNPRWSCDIDDPDSLMRMWDYWDAQLRVNSWRTALANHISSGHRAVDTFRALRSQWHGSLEVPDLALHAIDVTLRDRELAVDSFLSDPRILATPEAYVASEPGALPVPDLRIEFRGFTAAADQSLPGRAVVRQAPDGTAYASGHAFPGVRDDQARLEELDSKLELESLLEWCDLTFSSLSVPAHTIASARRELQELTRKRVLQLV